MTSLKFFARPLMTIFLTWTTINSRIYTAGCRQIDNWKIGLEFRSSRLVILSENAYQSGQVRAANASGITGPPLSSLIASRREAMAAELRKPAKRVQDPDDSGSIAESVSSALRGVADRFSASFKSKQKPVPQCRLVQGKLERGHYLHKERVVMPSNAPYKVVYKKSNVVITGLAVIPISEGLASPQAYVSKGGIDQSLVSIKLIPIEDGPWGCDVVIHGRKVRDRMHFPSADLTRMRNSEFPEILRVTLVKFIRRWSHAIENSNILFFPQFGPTKFHDCNSMRK